MYPYYNPSILAKSLNLIKSIKWGSILEGTQKTLGVINQAIPIVYQVKPLVSNAKTIFKISNIINNSSQNNQIQEEKVSKTNPIFYL